MLGSFVEQANRQYNFGFRLASVSFSEVESLDYLSKYPKMIRLGVDLDLLIYSIKFNPLFILASVI